MRTLTHPKYMTLIQTASTSFFFFFNYSFYHLPYPYIRLRGLEFPSHSEILLNLVKTFITLSSQRQRQLAARGHALSEAPNEKGSGMGNSPRLFHGEHHHHKEFIKFPCNGLIF